MLVGWNCCFGPFICYLENTKYSTILASQQVIIPATDKFRGHVMPRKSVLPLADFFLFTFFKKKKKSSIFDHNSRIISKDWDLLVEGKYPQDPADCRYKPFCYRREIHSQANHYRLSHPNDNCFSQWDQEYRQADNGTTICSFSSL